MRNVLTDSQSCPYTANSQGNSTNRHSRQITPHYPLVSTLILYFDENYACLEVEKRMQKQQEQFIVASWSGTL